MVEEATLTGGIRPRRATGVTAKEALREICKVPEPDGWKAGVEDTP